MIVLITKQYHIPLTYPPPEPKLDNVRQLHVDADVNNQHRHPGANHRLQQLHAVLVVRREAHVDPGGLRWPHAGNTQVIVFIKKSPRKQYSP